MRTTVVALISIGLLLNTSIPTVVADEEVSCEQLLEALQEVVESGDPIDEQLEQFRANCEDFLDDILGRECAQEFNDLDLVPENIRAEGASMWEVGALIDILGICVGTPLIPAWSDIGHTTIPYEITFNGKWQECQINENSPLALVDIGWFYSFGVFATISPATYDGSQSLGNSDIEFKVSPASENFPQASDDDFMRKDECEGKRSAAVADATTEAELWIQTQFENIEVPADANLNLLRMANGGHLFTLNWDGFCNFQVDFAPTTEDFGVKTWEFDCLLESGNVDSLVAHVSGGSFLLEHGELM